MLHTENKDSEKRRKEEFRQDASLLSSLGEICLGQAEDSRFIIVTVDEKKFKFFYLKHAKLRKTVLLTDWPWRSLSHRQPVTGDPRPPHFSIHPHFPNFFPSLPLPPFFSFKFVAPQIPPPPLRWTNLLCVLFSVAWSSAPCRMFSSLWGKDAHSHSDDTMLLSRRAYVHVPSEHGGSCGRNYTN